MSAIISYTSHDYMPITVIPVIASFDTGGHIVPLYVRLHGEPCKVDSFWISNRFSGQIEFHCKVVVGDTLRPLTLTYYKAEDVWAVPKT